MECYGEDWRKSIESMLPVLEGSVVHPSKPPQRANTQDTSRHSSLHHPIYTADSKLCLHSLKSFLVMSNDSFQILNSLDRRFQMRSYTSLVKREMN